MTIVKQFESLRQAEAYQNRLYGKHDSVKLVSSPTFSEEGQYVWNVSPAAVKPNRVPLYACQECGRKFYSTAAAQRASFGDNGCPGCGGSDIDLYVSQ